jgi:hypothetical protein
VWAASGRGSLDIQNTVATLIPTLLTNRLKMNAYDQRIDSATVTSVLDGVKFATWTKEL